MYVFHLDPVNTLNQRGVMVTDALRALHGTTADGMGREKALIAATPHEKRHGVPPYRVDPAGYVTYGRLLIGRYTPAGPIPAQTRDDAEALARIVGMRDSRQLANT